jgi:hypothetical protein
MQPEKRQKAVNFGDFSIFSRQFPRFAAKSGQKPGKRLPIPPKSFSIDNWAIGRAGCGFGSAKGTFRRFRRVE